MSNRRPRLIPPSLILRRIACRRWSLVLTLLACTLALLAAGGVRPTSTYAAIVLKPGDFIFGGTGHYVLVVDRAGSLGGYLSEDSHFGSPYYVATGPDGEVYVADSSYKIDDFTQRPAVARVDPTTGVATVVATGSFDTFGGITAERDGKLLVTDLGSQKIVRVDPATGTRSTVAVGGKLLSPTGLAVEADGSVLTTAGVSSPWSGPRQVVRVRASTGVQEVVSSGGLLINPADVAVSPDGSIFVADVGGSLTRPRVLRIDPHSGAQSVLTEFGGSLVGLVVDPAGTVFVSASEAYDSRRIFRIDPATGHRGMVSQPYSGYGGNLAMVQVGAPLPCPTRSPVSVKVAPLGSGRLQVTVHAGGTPNAIRRIQFRAVPNAVVESPPAIVGADATFVLQRTAPGAITLPFIVSDACGDWPTFVGGGPNAF
ncbi:MAG: SMP-30/gluconolactonase/LRE family protein [Chloroflexi bacterium]|nr:SMP-30/gluconolactonase/LRE family protein [Chloroflexota bacterium]